MFQILPGCSPQCMATSLCWRPYSASHTRFCCSSFGHRVDFCSHLPAGSAEFGGELCTLHIVTVPPPYPPCHFGVSMVGLFFFWRRPAQHGFAPNPGPMGHKQVCRKTCLGLGSSGAANYKQMPPGGHTETTQLTSLVGPCAPS